MSTADQNTFIGELHKKIDRMGVNAAIRTKIRRTIFDERGGFRGFKVCANDQRIEENRLKPYASEAESDPVIPWQVCAEAGDGWMVAQHLGLVRAYQDDYPFVRSIVKLDSHVNIRNPDFNMDKKTLSELISSVEEAAQAGADGVGWTVYCGSGDERMDAENIKKSVAVRQAAEKAGLIPVAWLYFRGAEVERRGGEYTDYMLEYVTAFGNEAAIPVLKIPMYRERLKGPDDAGKGPKMPAPYDTLQRSKADVLASINRAAGLSLVIVAGGPRSDRMDPFFEMVSDCRTAGWAGAAVGRNIFGQPTRAERVAVARRIGQVFHGQG